MTVTGQCSGAGPLSDFTPPGTTPQAGSTEGLAMPSPAGIGAFEQWVLWQANGASHSVAEQRSGMTRRTRE